MVNALWECIRAAGGQVAREYRAHLAPFGSNAPPADLFLHQLEATKDTVAEVKTIGVVETYAERLVQEPARRQMGVKAREAAVLPALRRTVKRMDTRAGVPPGQKGPAETYWDGLRVIPLVFGPYGDHGYG